MKPETVLLGDLCEITPSPSSDLFTGLTTDVAGIPVVTPADITKSQRVETDAMRRLQRAPAGLDRFQLRPGDLVLVRLGSVGKVALIGKEAEGWVYHSSCIRIRPHFEKVDPIYLAAYLAHPPVVDQLLSRVQVGTVPMLTARSLKELPMLLPDPHRQRLMAGALSEVGLQMDIQRRMLSRLHSVQQGLFTNLLGDEIPGAASKPTSAASDRRAPRTRRTNRMS